MKIFDTERSTLVNVVVLALGYLGLAVLADQLSFPGQLTAIWPASGLAAAAVIIVGFRVWPGILLGVYLNQMVWFYRGREQIAENGFFSEFIHNSLIGFSFGIGNVLEAWFIVWLVRKFIGSEYPLSKLSGVVRVLFLVPTVGPVVGALFGTLVICGLWEWTPWSSFFSSVWTWWISAVAGILIVMPPLLWFDSGKSLHIGQSARRRIEFALITLCLLFIVVLAFWASLPIEYLLLLVLLWSAFRFGEMTTVCFGTLTAVVAVYATVKGYGPFVSSSMRELTVNQTITLLQCFMSVLIITAGTLASVVAEWRKHQENLTLSNATLEQRVNERTVELRVAKELAENANASKSRFFAAASHDLRQPLHAMTFFVDALLIDFDKTGNTQAGEKKDRDDYSSPIERVTIVRKLRDTIENMRDLFNGILDISRIDANTVKVEKENFQLSELLQQLDREYRSIAHKFELEWRCDAVDVLVYTDPILLERILRNLLDNAMNYTVTGFVSIDVDKVDNGYLINVKDSGVGIHKDHQLEIFEEFFQADNKNRREKGLGLGLSIVRKLSDLLGQELLLESTPDQGTTVRLTVPAAVEIDSRASAAGKGWVTLEEDIDVDTAPKRVLVVDDDEHVADSTSSLLSRWGYDVRIAITESELVDCLANEWRPELAIVDYKLNENFNSNGLELLNGLSARIGQSIPGVIVSADTQPDFLRFMKENNILLLSKPIKPAKLRGVIRASLRSGAHVT